MWSRIDLAKVRASLRAPWCWFEFGLSSGDRSTAWYTFLEKALHEAHEEDEHAYPVSYCIELFEELNAVWAESVRESRRTLCAKLWTENPHMEDLKLIALDPAAEDRPNFQFPCIWDMQDPAGHYQTVVVPRQERALNRLPHHQLHDGTVKERKDAVRKTAGPDVPVEDSATDPKSGAAPLLTLDPVPESTGRKGDGKRKSLLVQTIPGISLSVRRKQLTVLPSLRMHPQRLSG